MSVLIHPTAVVEPGAELGIDVSVGPYTVIGPDVRVGDRTRIGAQVVLDGVTQIGEENVIVGQASIGGPPQDLSYRGEPTEVVLGDRNTVREFVTINRGTVKGGGVTRVGDGSLLMACCHIAHDCDLGNHIIIAGGVQLAGHTLIEDHANLSGMAGAVAFSTIGAHAYVGAKTRISRDVPPFMIVEGHDARVRGVNVVGLQRSGFTEADIAALRDAYRALWRSERPLAVALEELARAEDQNPHVARLVASLERTERGLKGRYRESLRQQFTEEGRQRILGAASPEA